MFLLGREPAALAAVARAGIALFAAFVLPLSIEQQGAMNAVIAAVLGIGVAVSVADEKAWPLLVGLVEAAVYLGVSFGWRVPAEKQALIVAFTAALVAVVVRDRVDAPVDRLGQRI